jgi:hypothetical protein
MVSDFFFATDNAEFAQFSKYIQLHRMKHKNFNFLTFINHVRGLDKSVWLDSFDKWATVWRGLL